MNKKNLFLLLQIAAVSLCMERREEELRRCNQKIKMCDNLIKQYDCPEPFGYADEFVHRLFLLKLKLYKERDQLKQRIEMIRNNNVLE